MVCLAFSVSHAFSISHSFCCPVAPSLCFPCSLLSSLALCLPSFLALCLCLVMAGEGDEHSVPLMDLEGGSAEQQPQAQSRTAWKWVFLGVVLVVAVGAVTVPFVVREHAHEDGASVAVITHEVDERGARAVDFNSHLWNYTFPNYLDLDSMERELADLENTNGTSTNHTRSRRSMACQRDYPTNTLLELTGFSEQAYNYRNFRNRPEDLATNSQRGIQVRALVFAVGTFQHGWFRDRVRVNPSSARVLAYMGSARLVDWVNNLNMFCMNSNRADFVGQARAVAQNAQAAIGSARIVLFTGHSLGGALAALQAGANRGCAVGFNSPPVSSLTRRTSDMVVYRTDADVVSMPNEPGNPTWQSINRVANALGLHCNQQQHIGTVHSLAAPSTFSVSGLMTGMLAGTVDSIVPGDYAQLARDALHAHDLDTLNRAISNRNQPIRQSWWCRNVRFGCQ